MADSDHSMNCACVTRRVAVFGGSAALGSSVVLGSPTSAAAASMLSTASDDPILALWQDWAATHQRLQELGDLLRKLEDRVAGEFDSFRVLVDVPGGKPVYVYSLRDLDHLVGDRTDMKTIRLQAERKLIAKQAEYDAISDRAGYAAGVKEEQVAFEHAKALLDTMMATPAPTLAGIAGKLDAIGRWGEAWSEHPGPFPWTYIRSAHDDLLRLGQRLTPDAPFPSSDA